MDSKTNEFAKIGKLVNTIITRYREIRKDCGIPDNGWHSRTIERMATPFIKGYFTLAVVGKVSSGKPVDTFNRCGRVAIEYELLG